MYSTPTLATRFARNTRVMRGDQPLSEDQMRAAAPSIFAEGKHASRSERYTYIPTIDVLRGLRKEGVGRYHRRENQRGIRGSSHRARNNFRPSSDECGPNSDSAMRDLSMMRLIAGPFRRLSEVHPNAQSTSRPANPIRIIPHTIGW